MYILGIIVSELLSKEVACEVRQEKKCYRKNFLGSRLLNIKGLNVLIDKIEVCRTEEPGKWEAWYNVQQEYGRR